jgi:hypothetical protein
VAPDEREGVTLLVGKVGPQQLDDVGDPFGHHLGSSKGFSSAARVIQSLLE